MTTETQQINIMEMLVALRGIKDEKNESPLSKDLESLIKAGLHSTDLPATLRPSAAEAFQLAFEAWGGVPRLLLFADRYPGAFLKLYARQTSQTMQPVIPPPPESAPRDEWPAWLTSRRLAYQEGPPSADNDAQEGDDS